MLNILIKIALNTLLRLGVTDLFVREDIFVFIMTIRKIIILIDGHLKLAIRRCVVECFTVVCQVKFLIISPSDKLSVPSKVAILIDSVAL